MPSTCWVLRLSKRNLCPHTSNSPMENLNIHSSIPCRQLLKRPLCARGLHATSVCEFLLAAGTNYHPLSGLKQLKCILLQFRRPEIRNGCHWAQSEVSMGRIPSFKGRIHCRAFSGFPWPLAFPSTRRTRRKSSKEPEDFGMGVKTGFRCPLPRRR